MLVWYAYTSHDHPAIAQESQCAGVIGSLPEAKG